MPLIEHKARAENGFLPGPHAEARVTTAPPFESRPLRLEVLKWPGVTSQGKRLTPGFIFVKIDLSKGLSNDGRLTGPLECDVPVKGMLRLHGLRHLSYGTANKKESMPDQITLSEV